ncbi:MAG: LamG-like jellyroll fold domain-containing protein, partial [Bacteroidota bacterium]
MKTTLTKTICCLLLLFNNLQSIAQTGAALHFDGNDYAFYNTSNSLLSPTGQITLEAWVYPENFVTGTSGIIARINTTGGYELNVNSNGTFFARIVIGGGTKLANGGSLPLNQW